MKKPELAPVACATASIAEATRVGAPTEPIAHTTAIHVEGRRVIVHVTSLALHRLGADLANPISLLGTLCESMADIGETAIAIFRRCPAPAVIVASADVAGLVPHGRQHDRAVRTADARPVPALQHAPERAF